MNTAERLQGYYPFAESVLDVAQEVADRQRSMEWQEFLTSCGMQDPQKYLVDKKATEYIEFRPTGDFDDTKARVFHAPMANPLDPNVAYQAATVFAFDPTTRLFATANPSGPDRDAALLSPKERAQVAGGDLSPTVEPTLRLLAKKGVESVVHIGGSYGAEKSMVAAQHAARFDHKVEAVVAIEPPSVTYRSLTRLTRAFAATNKHLEHYVHASDIPAYMEARKSSVGARDYMMGLLRLTNLSIAKGLAHGSFESRSDQALSAQPEMHATVVWGSESELAIDGLMGRIVHHLQGQYSEDRMQALRLPGLHHALMNDIHLQAAVAMQSKA